MVGRCGPRSVGLTLSALGLMLAAVVILRAVPSAAAAAAPSLRAQARSLVEQQFEDVAPPPRRRPSSPRPDTSTSPPSSDSPNGRQADSTATAAGCLPSRNGSLVAFQLLAMRGAFLSVGRDVVSEHPCWLHAARPDPGQLPPNVLFQLEALDGRGAEVALRSLSSGRLLRANAVGGDGPAWVVEAVDAGGPSAAAAAATRDPGLRWRLDVDESAAATSATTATATTAAAAAAGEPTTCTVHLLARGSGGYVNLPATGADGVTPMPDVRTHRRGGGGGAPRGRLSALGLRVVREEEAAHARRLVERSRRLRAPPPVATAVATGGARPAPRPAPRPARGGTIAIGTPVTSKGTRMLSVADSPFFNVLLKSVLGTWDGPSSGAVDGGGGGGGWRYAFYVGVDRGDPIYDGWGAEAAFRRSFGAAVGGAVGADRAALVPLRYTAFAGLGGRPSQVVAELMAQAYGDGAEWLFQLNDDACLQSRGWEAQRHGRSGVLVAPQLATGGS